MPLVRGVCACTWVRACVCACVHVCVYASVGACMCVSVIYMYGCHSSNDQSTCYCSWRLVNLSQGSLTDSSRHLRTIPKL